MGELLKRIIERAFRQSGGKTPIDVPLPDVFDVVEEMRKEFPVEFWWDVVTEEVQNGTSKIERERMPNATLPKNKANAVIDKDKVIDWFEKWLGNSES